MDKEQRNEVRELITDVIGKPLEEIIGRLNVITANMIRIEGNTERTETHTKETNGRVTKLEDAVILLQKENIMHTINCPQKAAIDTMNNKLTTIEKIEVGRDAIQKFTWKQLTGIGIVAGIVFGVLKFVMDFIIPILK